MLDHIGLTVSDLARSRTFYRAALAPLGFGVVMDLSCEQSGGFAGTGFGANGRLQFWIGAGERSGAAAHVAFVAADRAAVDAFHAAAVAAGATDNGAPGLRPHYHPNYYGAFVLDLDGNNIEAVCHAPA
ncbi:MAG: VOC family protein [Proteobacteria bacterium]|nr:VOC family protein [Pseudomonadota bacterium]MBS0464978.1 VOC family protein [Pseudomonadota bacterium]